MRRTLAAAVFTALSIATAGAQLTIPKEYLPKIHGTIRSKYELQTTTGMQRFQVRNARVSLDGKVLPVIAYKAEIDLSDEGSIKMLDAYARFVPNDTWNLTMGQMRVPFTIDAHRSPHQQYFANRSFIAKQVGLFNGSGLTQQKEWHNTLNYSAKLQLMPWKGYNLTLSTQKIHPDKNSIYMYDIGTYYKFSNWHFEVEYLYKTYAHNAFKDVHAFQRLTGGVTLSFGKAFQADLRINYEKYFYDDLSLAKESEQDKFVMELMVRF